jgi:hypothetical protein
VIFTFENEEHFAAYNQHPEHLAVLREHLPFFENLVEFDYIQE